MTMLDRADADLGGRGAARSGVAVAATVPSSRAVHPLTRDFLAWIAGGPRTYAAVMDAWQTSCPRLSIWEDALDDGLVMSLRGDGAASGQVIVTLTERGRAVLDGHN